MKKKILYLLLFILFFSWVWFSQRKIDRNEFQIFYSTGIDGVLEKDVWGNSGGNYVKVDNVTYVVRSVHRIKGAYIIFSDFAKAGDVLIKKEFSDTLILKKPNGEEYLFYFKKFE